MKATKVVYLLGLLSVVLGASSWVGCQHDKSSTSPAPSVTSAPSKDAPTDWEYKTVEKELPDSDLRKQMQEWSDQGWKVVSVSAPIHQADGTVWRKTELKRATQ